MSWAVGGDGDETQARRRRTKRPDQDHREPPPRTQEQLAQGTKRTRGAHVRPRGGMAAAGEPRAGFSAGTLPLPAPGMAPNRPSTCQSVLPVRSRMAGPRPAVSPSRRKRPVEGRTSRTESGSPLLSAHPGPQVLC